MTIRSIHKPLDNAELKIAALRSASAALLRDVTPHNGTPDMAKHARHLAHVLDLDIRTVTRELTDAIARIETTEPSVSAVRPFQLARPLNCTAVVDAVRR